MQVFKRDLIYQFAFCCMLFFVMGCARKQKHSSLNIKPSIDIQEILALHSEMPDVILGFYAEKVIVDKVNPSAVEVIYKSKKKMYMTQEAIKRSYLSDMELLGWQLVGEFVADDMQLLFQRPGNTLFCNVHIQSCTSIRVTLLPKQ